MRTGFRGTFVISWSQTSIDGLEVAPPSSLQVGAVWAWSGEVVRVDGPSELLELDQADGEAKIRRRAARMIRRLVGAAVSDTARLDAVELPLTDVGFVVTDGASTFTATLIEVEGGNGRPLLMFLDEIPPKGRDLWVVHHTLSSAIADPDAQKDAGVICFTPGTRILTPTGPALVETLREGDLIQTKDSGAQEVRWIGSRRMTGARLFAMPKLRPVRIRAGAFGLQRPDEALLVSPDHRMLIKGVVARALFNTDEVLVAARDLVNGDSITRDVTVREVTYVHMLLPRHEVVFANGVETESFHPASAQLASIREQDRARLLALMPRIRLNPGSYGAHARRYLTPSEAAILRHEAA